MKKIEIDMFKEYVGKLIFRCCVFLAVLLAYIFAPGLCGVGHPDGEHGTANDPAEQAYHDGQQKGLCESLPAGGTFQRVGVVPLRPEEQSGSNLGAAGMAELQCDLWHFVRGGHHRDEGTDPPVRILLCQ